MKDRSTVHAFVEMLHRWDQALDENILTLVRKLLIDFSKAFDHIDHIRLRAYNMSLMCRLYYQSGNFLFLSNRHQRMNNGDKFQNEYM